MRAAEIAARARRGKINALGKTDISLVNSVRNSAKEHDLANNFRDVQPDDVCSADETFFCPLWLELSW